jgi:anti-sigma factor RsiW
MGYKVLGLLVWRGARWYLRRRYPGAPRKLLVGGVALGAVAAGVAGMAVVRQRSAE